MSAARSARVIPGILNNSYAAAYDTTSSSRRPPGAAGRHHVQPTATISVGGDDWANQVINNVVGAEPAAVFDRNSADVRDRINQKKQKFHSDRCLELKNLPDGATEQDIRLALPDVDIVRVEIDRMDVPHRPGAKLYLKNPHILDEWPQHRDSVYVRNKEVNLCLGTSDKWLCLARLPFTWTEQHLADLVSAYGRVKQSFLVCSQLTGESKGYGLVKFQTHDGSSLAKQFLNGKIVEGEAIQVEWLNSSFIQYSQLHSKCLYVSNLPKNFRDLALFRRIFSVVKNPPYCQIAMKNGVLQDWGLVEFFDEKDAEKTQQEVHGYEVQGSRLQVHYCVPGVNAINIYMSLVTSPDTVSDKGLVDEVPGTTVYAQLNKLATQNPAFAQNLQKIIQNQVDKVESSSTTCPDNPHEQAALIILMAAQHQAEKDGPSLLQNQEVIDVLQNLVCTRNQYGSDQVDPYAQLMRIPSLQTALRQHAGHSEVSSQISSNSVKSPPPVIANNLNLLSNTETLNEMLGSLKDAAHSDQKENILLPLAANSSCTQPPLIAHSPPDFSKPPPNMVQPGIAALAPPPPPLPVSTQFLVPPPPPPIGRVSSIPSPSVISAAGHQIPGMVSPQGVLSSVHVGQPSPVHQPGMISNHVLTSPPPQQAPPPIPMTSGLLAPAPMQTVPGVYLPGLEGLLTPPVPSLPSPIQPTLPGGLHASLQSQLIYPAQTMFYNPLSPVVPNVTPVSAQLAGYSQMTGGVPNLARVSSDLVSPGGIMTGEVGLSSPPPVVAPVGSSSTALSAASNKVSMTSSTLPPVISTPLASKRKASIPPSPEDSPGGRPYIGQHSQGLGGHYADSYLARKRTKYR